jgi:uncharacterized protein YfiM (DUF2279 family)
MAINVVYAQAGVTQPHTDAWFGVDKIKHFFMSAFIQSFSYSALQAMHVRHSSAMAGSIGITIGLGIGREIHDKRTPGNIFSVRDLTWDLIDRRRRPAGLATLSDSNGATVAGLAQNRLVLTQRFALSRGTPGAVRKTRQLFTAMIETRRHRGSPHIRRMLCAPPLAARGLSLVLRQENKVKRAGCRGEFRSGCRVACGAGSAEKSSTASYNG